MLHFTLFHSFHFISFHSLYQAASLDIINNFYPSSFPPITLISPPIIIYSITIKHTNFLVQIRMAVKRTGINIYVYYRIITTFSTSILINSYLYKIYYRQQSFSLLILISEITFH